MAGAKYKKYFDEMFEAHRREFMEFMVLNQCYRDDKREFKSKFDEEGLKIQGIVKEWEDRLCGTMERGKGGTLWTTACSRSIRFVPENGFRRVSRRYRVAPSA